MAGDLRAAVEHQADEIPGFWLEAGQVALVFKCRRTPFNGFRDPVICFEDGISHKQHGIFQWMIERLEPLVNFRVGMAPCGSSLGYHLISVNHGLR